MRPRMGYDHKKYAANYDRIFKKPVNPRPTPTILGHAAFYPYPVVGYAYFDRSLWESAQRIIAENKSRKGRRKAGGKSTAPKLGQRRLTPPAKALPHRAGKHN